MSALGRDRSAAAEKLQRRGQIGFPKRSAGIAEPDCQRQRPGLVRRLVQLKITFRLEQVVQQRPQQGAGSLQEGGVIGDDRRRIGGGGGGWRVGNGQLIGQRER